MEARWDDDAYDLLGHRLNAAPPEALPADLSLWRPNPPQPGGQSLTCIYTGRAMSPQQMAYESEADELLFGGAPGGGKTHLAIGLAVTKHRDSVIFRREYTEFTGETGIAAKVDEVLEAAGLVLGRDYERNRSTRTWALTHPHRRSLQLAAVKDDRSMMKWRRPHDLKVFDELPEFPERYYRMLIGWLRTEKHRGSRTRVVATGNPPLTEEGRWVIRYWAPWLDPNHPRPAKPGELRWFANVDGQEDVERPNREPFEMLVKGKPVTVWPRSRTFVPAMAGDNPFYDSRYTGQVLINMPEPYGTMMASGDFGMAIPEDQNQIIPGAWVEAAMRRWSPDGGQGLRLLRVGSDPSRGGGAEFVIALLYGTWLSPLVVHPPHKGEITGPLGAELLLQATGGDRVVPMQIDMDGIGASVVDSAESMDLNVVRVNGAAPSQYQSPKGLAFFNVRSELHWRMRELLDPQTGIGLALPPDPQLKADLCAPRFQFVGKRIKVEPKDDVIKRLKRSPDRGEAVMYACVGVAKKAPKPRRPLVLW